MVGVETSARRDRYARALALRSHCKNVRRTLEMKAEQRRLEDMKLLKAAVATLCFFTVVGTADAFELGAGVQDPLPGDTAMRAASTSSFLAEPTGKERESAVRTGTRTLDKAVRLVESHGDALKTLGISARLTVRFGKFKGRATFDQLESQYRERRTSAIWACHHATTVFTVRDPWAFLSEDGKAKIREIEEALKGENRDVTKARSLYRTFTDSAGQQMIWQQTKRASVIVAYEHQSSTHLSHRSISASIRARYGPHRGSALLTRFARRKSNDLSAQARLFAIGIDGETWKTEQGSSLRDLKDPDKQFRAIGRQVSSMDPKNGAVIDMQIRPWWRVLGLPRDVLSEEDLLSDTSQLASAAIEADLEIVLSLLDEHYADLRTLTTIRSRAEVIGDYVRAKACSLQMAKVRASRNRLLWAASRIARGDHLADRARSELALNAGVGQAASFASNFLEDILSSGSSPADFAALARLGPGDDSLDLVAVEFSHELTADGKDPAKPDVPKTRRMLSWTLRLYVSIRYPSLVRGVALLPTMHEDRDKRRLPASMMTFGGRAGEGTAWEKRSASGVDHLVLMAITYPDPWVPKDEAPRDIGKDGADLEEINQAYTTHARSLFKKHEWMLSYYDEATGLTTSRMIDLSRWADWQTSTKAPDPQDSN